MDNESHIESLSQAISRHSVPFDPSSEMHRRGKVFGFRFIAGGMGEDEVVADVCAVADGEPGLLEFADDEVDVDVCADALPAPELPAAVLAPARQRRAR